MITAAPPITPADILAGLAIVGLVWLACRVIWPPMPTTKENPDMSVRTIDHSDGPKYEVRWRDHDGRHRSLTFRNSADAIDFDHAVQAWQAKSRADRAWDAIPQTARTLIAIHAN